MSENEVKVVNYDHLTIYRKEKIIRIASKNISIDKMAKLLKSLQFCTAETTLRVIEENNKDNNLLADEDFVQLKAKLLEPKAEPEHTATKTEQTAVEQAEEPTVAETEQVKPTEEPAQSEQKKQKADSMSKNDTMIMISRHLEGFTNAEIGKLLGRTETQIAKRLSNLKKSKRYGYLFGKSDNENPKGEETMEHKKDKCYVARGEGHIFVDAIKDEISVNDDCVLRKIAEYLDNQGISDFYGRIEVRITVMNKPVGMQISEE